MLSCHLVADYLLLHAENNDDALTNLKLQKLAYYAQGFHLALHDKPLFQEDIEAWQHGPVVPELYHRFKAHGRNILPPPTDTNISVISEETVELLTEVYEVYGQYSAWRLREMTHQESPWLKNINCQGVISHADLKEYFLTRLQ